MRGEYSSCGKFFPARVGSPPLARGVPLAIPYISNHFRITPACAGSTALCSFRIFVTKDHPRLRGEYRREYSSSEFLLGSPPLARGVLNTIPTIARSGRITPACAGSTARGNVFLQRFQDHPRLRGEYFISLGTDTEILGSPPLARGVRLHGKFV